MDEAGLFSHRFSAVSVGGVLLYLALGIWH